MRNDSHLDLSGTKLFKLSRPLITIQTIKTSFNQRYLIILTNKETIMHKQIFCDCQNQVSRSVYMYVDIGTYIVTYIHVHVHS